MKRAPLRRRTPLDGHAAARRYEERLRAEGFSRFRTLGPNRARQKKRRERDFGQKATWVASFPCCACGRHGPSDPHHHPTRAAGGTSKDLVPLCRDCHRFYHSHGAETFADAFGVDLVAVAAELEGAWHVSF